MKGMTGMAGQYVEAVVQAGSWETTYIRCGRIGRDLLLLLEEDAARQPLIRVLGERYRVVAPTTGPWSRPSGADGVPAAVAAAAATVELWIRGIIEGLGLQQPVIIASPQLAGAAAMSAAAAGDEPLAIVSLNQLVHPAMTAAIEDH